MNILDDIYVQDDAGETGLQVDSTTKKNWRSTAKWATFIAVINFILIGLVLLALATIAPMLRYLLGSPSDGNLGAVIGGLILRNLTFFVLVWAAVWGAINYFHLVFSNKIQHALQYKNQNSLESAWSNLKWSYRLIGIVVIAVFVVNLVIALVFMANLGKTGAGPEL